MQNYKSKSKIFKSLVAISTFLFSIFHFPFSSNVYAATEFSNAYDVIYEVKNSGITTVTQNIHLTNLTTNYYASEYTLIFGTEEIDDISAWDSQGPLKIDVKKGVDLTQIHAVFNEKVVGQGKTLNWTLRYQSPEIGKKLGRIWEINIPRFSQEEQASTYNVTLTYPPEFGQPSYVWPKPKKPNFWTLDERSRQGISLAFGDWQGFKFELTYHLENPQIAPGESLIALPLDTPYQKVFLERITPKPSDIVVDEDGNWIATFLLLPKQKKDIKVSGFAQVFLTSRDDFPQEQKEKIYQKYLKPQKFWEQDEKIINLAKELKTPEAIYNYVVSTLSYDYGRARQETVRLGAKQALANPDKAICMEFTDLFISLSRAAGIPAREVDGVAMAANSKLKPLSLVTDVLHAWPEYWDEQKNIWVQVDPTWGRTSLINYFNRFDFNHLAFVKRGVDSTRPYPAGSYKSKNETEEKDVFVDFSSNYPIFATIPPKAEIIFPKMVIAGLPITGQLRVVNNNKVALYNLKPTLTSSSLPLKDKDFNLLALPPLTQRTLKVELGNSNPFLFAKNTLSLKIDDQETAATFQIIPLPFIVLPIILVFFILILLVFLVVKKIWTKSSKKP